ncbi:MAG: hypothetical protein HQL87_03180 [Magnetococcales bacterium]|nr:hypothetical protein [Magnetococcales bacterium]
MLPLWVFALLSLGLLLARLDSVKSVQGLTPIFAALLTAVGLQTALLLWNPQWATLGYPVVMSGCSAGAFLFTLFSPPVLVERLAALRAPPPAEAHRYLRAVTCVWGLFLALNTAVATWTVYRALQGDIATWTVYNGLLSYLCMGGLFLGEWLLRKKLQGRSATQSTA